MGIRLASGAGFTRGQALPGISGRTRLARTRETLNPIVSWIEEIEVTEAEGKLAEVYAELLEKRGKVANILQVHSLQ